MNEWQKIYCEELYDGKMPRTNIGKQDFELLGKIGTKVIVEFPCFDGVSTHKEEYEITAHDCNMPNGKIDVVTLVSNIALWSSRGFKISTDK